MSFSSHFGNFFCVVFGNEVLKILRNSLFIFHFHFANGKRRTENHATKVTNLPKTKSQKYVMSRERVSILTQGIWPLIYEYLRRLRQLRAVVCASY